MKNLTLFQSFRTFLLAFVCLFAIINACQKTTSSLQELEDPSNTPASSRTDVDHQDIIDAYYLASIAILEKEDLVNYIKGYTIDDEVNDLITFEDLEIVATSFSIDLIDLMRHSVTDNGGTTAQANLVEDHITGYTNNSNTYVPCIFLPYGESASSEHDVILAKGSETEPVSTWSGAKYTDGAFSNNLTITQVIIEATPLFVITSDDPNEALWLPWRRCYCSPPIIYNNEMSSYGTCDRTHGDEARCRFKCERTGFDGVCSGASCESCY